MPEQKVILCGEYGVGKSSLFRRFTNNSYTTATDRQSTLGLDHYSKPFYIAGKNIKVNLTCLLVFVSCHFVERLYLTLLSSNYGTQLEWSELHLSHQAITSLLVLQS